MQGPSSPLPRTTTRPGSPRVSPVAFRASDGRACGSDTLIAYHLSPHVVTLGGPTRQARFTGRNQGAPKTQIGRQRCAPSWQALEPPAPLVSRGANPVFRPS